MTVKNTRLALLILAVVTVPACGGGGRGGGGPAPAGGPEVAFVADATQTGTDELFAAGIDGTGLVNLSGPLVAGGDVTLFSWSPDGTKVACLAAGGGLVQIGGPGVKSMSVRP